MKPMILVMLLAVAAESAAAQVPGAGQSAKPVENGCTYALIVSGINKYPEEQKAKEKVVTDLRKFFLDNGKVSPSRLSVLVGSDSSVHEHSKTSTSVNLNETFSSLAKSVNPADRFIFYYVGQANIVVDKLRLNLPGTDVTHEQLAEWMNEMKASSILIVLDCPGAGLAVKALSRKGRIVIAACTADQRYSTQFSRYFIGALTDSKGDVDGDGRVSPLEAFTSASRGLDDWYRERQLLKTETPLLEDDGDGLASWQPWRYEQDGKDGMAAAMFFL